MQLSHDIDLMMPFTRTRSKNRSETSKKPPDASKVEDEVEFERALSSVDGKSPRYNQMNDENMNINSNMQQAAKLKKVTVARIQKNKVNFIPSASAASNHLKIRHQAETGKIESIINSTALLELMSKSGMARATDNQASLPRSQSGSTLRRMQSETVFGKPRGESVNSNGGSQARVIEVPKVVKAIHVAPSSETEQAQSPEEVNLENQNRNIKLEKAKPSKG